MGMFSAFENTYDLLAPAFGILWAFHVVWLPFLLVVIFAQVWMKYVRMKYIAGQDFILLEIRIPKEIQKSPAAMEIVLNALHQVSAGNYLDVYIKGKVRQWFSLEIVSNGGQIHFYVWTPKGAKDSIEAQIYSQYPTVEIYEVDDYARAVFYDPENMAFNGAQMALTKPDPYPIKTYIDYGLDKDPKEEFKIDPITAMIEFLGNLKPHDQAWIQILIQAHKSEGAKEGRLIKKADWKDAAKKEMEEILKKGLVKPKSEESPKLSELTVVQKDIITAIERSISKNAFDTMIRLMYIAPKDKYSAATNGALLGVFKQFSSNTLNGFKKGWGPRYDYPWQDFRSSRKNRNEMRLLDAYKRRSFFHPPYRFFKGRPFVLTTEELATVYHFPGIVSQTPTFERIPSRKAEPPANLPM